jgi:hypothetical protein
MTHIMPKNWKRFAFTAVFVAALLTCFCSGWEEVEKEKHA